MKDRELGRLTLTRWVIPGWVAILAFLFFIAIDVVTSQSQPHEQHLFSNLGDLVQSLSDENALLLAFLTAGAGVPIGFLIYQSYYFLRWNSPFSYTGLLSIISGRKWGHDVLTHELEDLLSLGTEWRQKILDNPLYQFDHRYQGGYLDLLFLEICQVLDSEFSGLSIYSRLRYLREILHTLGASIGGVFIGLIGYIAVKYLKENIHLPSYLMAGLAICGGFFLLLHFEQQWYKKMLLEKISSKDASSFLKDKEDALSIPPTRYISLGKGRVIKFAYPSSKFILTLTLIHLFANPAFAATWGVIWQQLEGLTHLFANPALAVTAATIADLSLRSILSVPFLYMWVKLPYPREFRNGSCIWASISLVLGIVVGWQRHLLHWIDWPFFTVLVAFLYLNLTLFMNRETTNIEMLSLMRYTMFRYLLGSKASLWRELWKALKYPGG